MIFYLTLFKVSFLAATILPMGCEPYFIFLLNKSELDPYALIFWATLGNSIGSMTTFGIAWFLPLNKAISFFKINPKQFDKVENSFFKRAGFYAFWCWLPIIGDLLAVFYGHKRYPYKTFLLFMTAGKLVRFLIIYYLLF